MDGDIELRHLRYFVAVAEELHFGRAALRLHLAQPPLSQQIRKLEGALGYPLFLRTSRAVKLTSAGEVFLERARRTLRNVQEDMEEARSIGRGEEGFLRVGFIGSAMLTAIPAMLGRYRRLYPKVNLQLHESYTSASMQKLFKGELDAGFLRDAVKRPASRWSVSSLNHSSLWFRRSTPRQAQERFRPENFAMSLSSSSPDQQELSPIKSRSRCAKSMAFAPKSCRRRRNG